MGDCSASGASILLPVQGVLSSQRGALARSFLFMFPSEMDLAALRWLLQHIFTLHSPVLIFLTSRIPISVHFTGSSLLWCLQSRAWPDDVTWVLLKDCCAVTSLSSLLLFITQISDSLENRKEKHQSPTHFFKILCDLLVLRTYKGGNLSKS